MALPAVMDYDCRFTGRTWERRFRAIQRHIYSHKIMEADRYSSGVEGKENPHQEDHHLRLRHPRTSQKGVRSTSKGGRSKSPTSADFRAVIKEKNKMEVEIGEYQKTLDEMSAAMANLNQEDYGSTIRIQELERTMRDCQQAVGTSSESPSTPHG